MTIEEIKNMLASREMDALITEKVFGVSTYQSFGGDYMIKSSTVKNLNCPHYSTNIEYAWKAVECACEYDNVFSIWNIAKDGSWRVRLTSRKEPAIFEASADTAPLAICRALLLATNE